MYPIETARYLVWRISERLHVDERGQTAAEYMGIIAVVALIIAALAGTDIGTTIQNGIKTKIAEILGGGAGGLPAP